MSKLIDFNSSPVKDVLPVLLKDRTTGRNIIFATDAYLEVSTYFGEKCEIEIEMLRSGELQICPRVEKHFDEQRSRQKAKAEVFTPSWICNQMNNYCDQFFFQRDNVFNPKHTFIDPYMKSGLYITEIVKRLYRSKRMEKLFPDPKARLRHIFENQVYGLAPTEIIYRISLAYILGFDETKDIVKHNFRMVDTIPYAKEGKLKQLMDQLFGPDV